MCRIIFIQIILIYLLMYNNVIYLFRYCCGDCNYFRIYYGCINYYYRLLCDFLDGFVEYCLGYGGGDIVYWIIFVLCIFYSLIWKFCFFL